MKRSPLPLVSLGRPLIAIQLGVFQANIYGAEILRELGSTAHSFTEGKQSTNVTNTSRSSVPTIGPSGTQANGGRCRSGPVSQLC